MLIGLCGLPRSGKTVIANILVQKHGFTVLDTKQLLRKLAADLTGLQEYDFVTQEDKATLYNGVSRRKIMGELGNVAEKLWGDSFLLNRALEELDRYNNPSRKIVVDALRKDQPIGFPGLVYEVIADRGFVSGEEFDVYDKSRINGVITNMGTISDLEKSVKKAFML